MGRFIFGFIRLSFRFVESFTLYIWPDLWLFRTKNSPFDHFWKIFQLPVAIRLPLLIIQKTQMHWGSKFSRNFALLPPSIDSRRKRQTQFKQILTFWCNKIWMEKKKILERKREELFFIWKVSMGLNKSSALGFFRPQPPYPALIERYTASNYCNYLIVQGFPTLTQCHSLLRPWWLGSESTLSLSIWSEATTLAGFYDIYKPVRS